MVDLFLEFIDGGGGSSPPGDQRRGATPAAGFPDPAHAMPRPPNNHLSYVATWYGLAIVFVAIYGLWLRRRLKDAA